MTTKTLAEMYKLKNITRYNNKAKLHTESVAEHSFFVSLIALQLADEYHLSDSQKLKCLEKAILHDMPEIELNDITHDVKLKLNLHPLLKTFEDKYYETNYPAYKELFNADGKYELIDNIVDLADAYSVLQFVEHEKSLGNVLEEWNIIVDEISERILQIKNKLAKI